MESKSMALFFIILAVMVWQCEPASWKSKKKEREFKMKIIERGPEFDWVSTIREPCKDELKHCNELGNLCTLEIVRVKCKDTCGQCRAEAPPDCKISEFGCCWDNFTMAEGKYQEGCPVCKDKYQEECKAFASQCGRSDIRIMCPETCGIKCETCEDDRYQKDVCGLYKEHGFCTVSPVLMKKICKRTCEFCPR